MPFLATFDCLWCGTAWRTRGPDDLEGYAQLCPDCVGRAGENGFLRFRLKSAIEERARAGESVAVPASAGARPARPCPPRPCPPRRSSPRRWSPTTRPAPTSTTTGISAEAGTPTGRSTTRPGTPSSTRRPCGSTGCRCRARSSSWRRAPAGGARCWPRRASCRSTTRPTPRSIAPVSGWWPTDCALTSTSAMPGRSRIERSTWSLPGSG